MFSIDFLNGVTLPTEEGLAREIAGRLDQEWRGLKSTVRHRAGCSDSDSKEIQPSAERVGTKSLRRAALFQGVS
jgi:hypothetical protein